MLACAMGFQISALSSALGRRDSGFGVGVRDEDNNNFFRRCVARTLPDKGLRGPGAGFLDDDI
jgi:hypothetical protein